MQVKAIKLHQEREKEEGGELFQEVGEPERTHQT